jgi:GAF domain-containing protein
MKRRSGAGGPNVKSRRRKSATLKRSSASNATRNRGASIAGHETVVARLTQERDEALLRETANSEILRLISKSPGDLELVFRAILENATRICNANFGILFRFDGENFHPVAHFNTPAAFLEAFTRRGPFKPTPGILLDHVMRTKQVAHSADSAAEPVTGLAQKLGGARSLVCVPMLKDRVLVGAVTIYRQEVRPFTDKQITLLQNFAAQAVIAIENTRLLNELRESLDQQTAAADVLRVINSSSGDLEPVFHAILEKAVRICDANFGILQFYQDGTFRLGAMHNAPPAFAEALAQRGPLKPGPLALMSRVVATKQLVHVSDYTDEPAYKQRDPSAVRLVELAGGRTIVMVPMLKEMELIGIIQIYRQEVRPFTDKQIGLVQNFAAQAVIAIENARLLNELRQRTTDLTESLQQQTATSEVLRVVSSSPGDLEPVFQAMLENAVRICDAKFGALFEFADGAFRALSNLNTPPALIDFNRELRVWGPHTALGQLAHTRQTIHVEDALADRAYREDTARKVAVQLGGIRTLLAVPMLKEDVLVGAITIFRQEVRPFTDKQISLVTNFGAQAVIAIENTRLLNELRESLERQTATADVLRVISSSPGELQPVFEALLHNAVRICNAQFGNLALLEGEGVRFVAQYGAPPKYRDVRQREPFIRWDTRGNLERVIKTKQVVHVADVAAEEPHSGIATLAGARTLVNVPMLKDDELVGFIAIYRQEVRPFSDKQIELVQNFAAQAVIAIENARLLSELRQRTTDLGEALEQQIATADVLRVISSSPGDLEPVFQAMLEKAVSICDAKFGTLFRFDGSAFHLAARVNTPAALAEFQKKRGPFLPPSGSNLDRMMKTKQVQHSADDAAEPVPAQGLRLGGARSIVHVPMLQGEQLVGALAIYRQEIRPFTEKQIELLKNFAAQAVISIENARLLNELRLRTVDLTESLEHQTATSEVFQLISSPQAPVQAVLDSVAANAVRLCEALHATIYLRDGEFVVIHAHSGPLGRTPIGTPQVANNNWVTGRAVLEGRTIHVPDLQNDDDYPQGKEIALRLGHRTTLAVPLISNDTAVGAILLRRWEARPFNDRQIALVQNFAAQAVIAIENARLLKELRERTEEVVKLNQQLEQRVSDQVGEIERMGRLRRFLPPQVADLIVASGTEKQLESHRREITALFCDLRGFTGFSESSDPEDVIALLRDYHAAIGQIIVKYSGTLERFAGDGVMVIFNDPVPVENPALQAVLMALDMRTAIGAMIEKWRDLGHDLGFGIGIAHGFATLGTIGFEGRFDYAAIGTVSNVASRLCDEAKPGQILISPRVRQAVEKAVTVEPVGEFALKGIRRPLMTYNVLEALSSKPN